VRPFSPADRDDHHIGDTARIPVTAATRTDPDATVPERATPEKSGTDRTGTEASPSVGRAADGTGPAPDSGRPDTDAPEGDVGDTAGSTADAPCVEPGGRPGAPLALPLPRLPLPAETVSTARQRPNSWEGWWEGPLDGTGEPADEEVPAPVAALDVVSSPSLTRVEPVREAPTDTPVRSIAAVADPPAAGDPAGRRLRRRVPQAHLAAGLRVIPPQPESDTAPPPSAAEALSRYQASRAAAQSAVESDGPHERTSR
jgi:hypothetical protein